jgi:hypothetical protein
MALGVARTIRLKLATPHRSQKSDPMRCARTLILAASIGMAAGIVAPAAEACVVIGVSVPVPVVRPVVVAAAPPAVVYPVYGPGSYCCGYRHAYGYYAYEQAGIVRGAFLFRHR